jgi:hypothetical protein
MVCHSWCILANIFMTNARVLILLSGRLLKHVRLSDAVAYSSAIFYEADGAPHGFIGDVVATSWATDPNAWRGDTLHLQSVYGICNVSFIDEADTPTRSSIFFMSMKAHFGR